MGGCCGFGWEHLGTWGGLGMGLIGLLLNLLFIGGLLVVLGGGVFWIVRQVRATSPSTAPTVERQVERPEALEIARRRLAAGEITVAEFEEIRERLQS